MTWKISNSYIQAQESRHRVISYVRRKQKTLQDRGRLEQILEQVQEKERVSRGRASYRRPSPPAQTPQRGRRRRCRCMSLPHRPRKASKQKLVSKWVRTMLHRNHFNIHLNLHITLQQNLHITLQLNLCCIWMGRDRGREGGELRTGPRTRAGRAGQTQDGDARNFSARPTGTPPTPRALSANAGLRRTARAVPR